MIRSELAIILDQGPELCKSFVQNNILPRLTMQQRDHFWSSKNLYTDDYEGLTKYCLQQELNTSILIPIEDVDHHGFHLKVTEPTIAGYTAKILSTDLPSFKARAIDTNPVTVNKLLETPSNDVLDHKKIFYFDQLKICTFPSPPKEIPIETTYRTLSLGSFSESPRHSKEKEKMVYGSDDNV